MLKKKSVLWVQQEPKQQACDNTSHRRNWAPGTSFSSLGNNYFCAWNTKESSPNETNLLKVLTEVLWEHQLLKYCQYLNLASKTPVATSPVFRGSFPITGGFGLSQKSWLKPDFGNKRSQWCYLSWFWLLHQHRQAKRWVGSWPTPWAEPLGTLASPTWPQLLVPERHRSPSDPPPQAPKSWFLSPECCMWPIVCSSLLPFNAPVEPKLDLTARSAPTALRVLWDISKINSLTNHHVPALVMLFTEL